ncbi:MAG: recombinase family protein [Albidovulum sp.]|nr:recombinase family protein [Albidovulum sp.]
MDHARPGDRLCVTRLDRLGRSLRELLETVDTLKARGIHLMSLEERLDTAEACEDDGRGASLVDVPGRTSQIRYVFDHTENSATLGLVAVDWANDDPADCLAGAGSGCVSKVPR